MASHVCPWWGGYFIDNRLRRWLHDPQKILSPYVRPDMEVLDFGCGMGFFSIAMAQLVGRQGRVVAIDLQQQMLDVLNKRARRAKVGDRIHTHQCQRDTLDYQGKVDFALAFYSAHEVPDPARLLQEIAECLTVDHQLLLVEPIGHVTKRQFREFLELASERGFRLEEQPRVRLSHTALLTRTDIAPAP